MKVYMMIIICSKNMLQMTEKKSLQFRHMTYDKITFCHVRIIVVHLNHSKLLLPCAPNWVGYILRINKFLQAHDIHSTDYHES